MPQRVEGRIDIRAMFERSVGFIQATQVLYAKLTPHTPLLAFPVIVSQAFATELALKSLRCVESNDNPLKTHNLLRLFDDVSDESRRLLETEWNKFSKATYPRPPNIGADEVPLTLRDMLGQAAQAFVDWRYPSPEGVFTANLGSFPIFVVNRVLALRPAWKQMEHTYKPG